MPGVVADAGDGEVGQLPEVAVTDLGGGHAELAANLAEETAHDLALAFQRAIVGQVELDPEDADVHGRLTLPAIINSVNITHAVELARAGREQAEKDLFEHLRTPSVSALSEHAADCRKAAGWLLQRLQRMGMDARLVEGDGHPLVFAEWLGRPGKPVLTIYGHYDVQPPDPLELWVTPPFEPAVREGRVYARGSVDNKGQHVADLKALEYAFAAGGPPLNVRVWIEGEEEGGGPVLPTFVRENADQLQTDYLFVADGEFIREGLPSLEAGLRGILYTEIEVRGGGHDLHSGQFGGLAPNPLNTVGHIIAGLKGRDGRVLIPGFYDDVRPPDSDEVKLWVPIQEEDVLRQTGAPALEGEPEFSLAERRQSRPTLDVHGVRGGFTGEGTKTVIPAAAVAKVSMRLVPDQDPAKVFAAYGRYVEELATPGTRVEVREIPESSKALSCDLKHPGVPAFRRACLAAFGAEPGITRAGGTLPVMSEVDEILHPNWLLTGFGLPGDGAHSPNEHMSLEQFHGGTVLVLHLLDELGKL